MKPVSEFILIKKNTTLPRIPLSGDIDLTYRCNNNCRHCWLRIPQNDPKKKEELSFDEIIKLVDEARKMGCREWSLCGGEPMLRSDFSDIFDYITSKSTDYTLNTNGTLITPEISKLMKRNGRKLIALYGADEHVHDHITRTPGSFQAMQQGIAYLNEAGASFAIQIVPMKDNYHQLEQMIQFANALGVNYRMGASWLYLAADADPQKNQEILEQRLDPEQHINIDPPDCSFDPSTSSDVNDCPEINDDSLYAGCINSKRSFHLDPYGGLSFCAFIKDPRLRYSLKNGSFSDFWDTFIPSLSEHITGDDEFRHNCKACNMRAHCKWCPVYGFLEHGRHSAKVDYLCDIAAVEKKHCAELNKKNRRYYKIAGLTILIECDQPILESTFHTKFKHFETDGPGSDMIIIRHHFTLPKMDFENAGTELYRKIPWAIYEKNNSFIYLGISSLKHNQNPHQVALVNMDHTQADIYSPALKNLFEKGGIASLSLFPTDQILLSRCLANRDACFLHSAGVILSDQGFLFAGHSDAGKSTITMMLKNHAEILCDDRMIIRKWEDGFKIHGTWSHGDVPDVSSSAASLRAIFFLEQAEENKAVLIRNTQDSFHKILECLIKPLETKDWWEKMILLSHRIAKDVPCYILKFDKTGNVFDIIKKIAENSPR